MGSGARRSVDQKGFERRCYCNGKFFVSLFSGWRKSKWASAVGWKVSTFAVAGYTPIFVALDKWWCRRTARGRWLKKLTGGFRNKHLLGLDATSRVSTLQPWWLSFSSPIWMMVADPNGQRSCCSCTSCCLTSVLDVRCSWYLHCSRFCSFCLEVWCSGCTTCSDRSCSIRRDDSDLVNTSGFDGAVRCLAQFAGLAIKKRFWYGSGWTIPSSLLVDTATFRDCHWDRPGRMAYIPLRLCRVDRARRTPQPQRHRSRTLQSVFRIRCLMSIEFIVDQGTGAWRRRLFNILDSSAMKLVSPICSRLSVALGSFGVPLNVWVRIISLKVGKQFALLYQVLQWGTTIAVQV